MLNRLGMDHDCDRQTDGGQTKASPYSADRSISIRSKSYTDFHTQIMLISESQSGYITQTPLDNAFVLREYRHK